MKAGIQGTPQKILLGVLACALILLASWLAAPYIPGAVDWHTVFRPAALEVLALRSPYTVPGFYNPPWALIPLLPLALLPEGVGRVLLMLATLLANAYIGYRLGGSKISITALLLSPLIMHELLNGNIDWLAMLGFVMPPWLGIFFVTAKPQIGTVVILFWLVEAWIAGGYKAVLRMLWPVALAGLASVLLFGLWFLHTQDAVGFVWNASLWPVSIPIGLALAVAALRKRKIEYAMAASPCLSPYVVFHSWVGALLAIISSTPETVAAVIGLWILVALRFFKLA